LSAAAVVALAVGIPTTILRKVMAAELLEVIALVVVVVELNPLAGALRETGLTAARVTAEMEESMTGEMPAAAVVAAVVTMAVAVAAPIMAALAAAAVPDM